MRVYQVLAPARFGGAETVCLSLSAALVGIGVDCTLVVLLSAGRPEELLARAERTGVPTVVLASGRRGYHRDVEAVRRRIARDDQAVLHSHLARANLVAAAAATLAGRPRVATLHGHSGRRARERLYDAADRCVLRTMDVLVAVSHTAAADVERWRLSRARRVVVVPSAVRPEPPLPAARARAELGLPADAAVVGWLGRFVPGKRPDLFVRSVADLARRGAAPSGWQAAMVGSGPELGAARELAASLGVADRIVFAGFRPDADRLVTAFDVLAVTSDSEALPTVVLECLAHGVPVVSTPVGDVPRMAARCAAVVLADPTPDAFGVRLGEHVSGRAGRGALAAAGTVYVAEWHAPAPWARVHRDLYADLLVRRRRASAVARPQCRSVG